MTQTGGQTRPRAGDSQAWPESGALPARALVGGGSWHLGLSTAPCQVSLLLICCCPQCQGQWWWLHRPVTCAAAQGSTTRKGHACTALCRTIRNPELLYLVFKIFILWNSGPSPSQYPWKYVPRLLGHLKLQTEPNPVYNIAFLPPIYTNL